MDKKDRTILIILIGALLFCVFALGFNIGLLYAMQNMECEEWLCQETLCVIETEADFARCCGKPTCLRYSLKEGYNAK